MTKRYLFALAMALFLLVATAPEVVSQTVTHSRRLLTTFTCLGACTSTYPAIKRSSTEILFRNGADSGYVSIVGSGIGVGGAPTMGSGTIAFAATSSGGLSALNNGTILYCSDCTIANPCAGGGTGAFAKRLNGVWVCN
jgi:hypothetical protein